MKKLVLSIAIIAGFASCEKKAEVLGTGSLNINAIVDANSTDEVGKKAVVSGVNRGETIPVYVGDITVETTSAGGATSTTFELEGDGTGVTGEMNIPGLPIGVTQLTATTAPVLRQEENGDYEVPFYLRKSDALWTPGGTSDLHIQWATQGNVLERIRQWTAAQFKVDYEKTAFPIYAKYYNAKDISATVVYNEPADISIPMTTDYGRLMVTFVNEAVWDGTSADHIAEAYSIRVTANTSANPTKIAQEAYTTDEILYSYWSNSESVDGAKIFYTIEWLEKDSDVVLRTEQLDLSIEALQSKWVNVIIMNDSYRTDEQALLFEFADIVEVNEDIIIE